MSERNPEIYEEFLGQFTAQESALRAYVRRLVPTRQDVADVMQGVALVLWKKYDELDHPDNFRKWAFGVARYEALAWLRDQARDRRVLAGDLIEQIAREASAREALLEAQREALEGCLEKIPTGQRALVLQAYSPEAQIQEIAQQSGRTVGGFYQWLHRIRLRLMDCTERAVRVEGLS
ncbi:MAG: sigma-70 family RNA polymerase sigma factor [Planctomycetaceae bacterium]|nr:sigma-70 family RNA polymerase sigma factor [Planctomycetaceae bacterium]